MSNSRGSLAIAFTTLVLFLSLFSNARAQTYVDARMGAYVDAEDLFVGGGVLTRIVDSFYLNPNVEYVFAERADVATFNFDFHYDFPERRNVFAWAGAGLAVLYNDPDGPIESNTDVGANLLFGVGFDLDPVIPYIQGKVILSEDNEFVLGFGVRF